MRNRIRRSLGVLAVSAVLAGGGLTATAAPASAMASDCWNNIAVWRTQAFGGCNGGWGHYKVAAECRNMFGYWAYRETGWIGLYWNGMAVTCPSGYTIMSSWTLAGN